MLDIAPFYKPSDFDENTRDIPDDLSVILHGGPKDGSRPESIKELLTDTVFFRPMWESYFALKGSAFFCLDGANLVLPLFGKQSFGFLKTEGYADAAVSQAVLQPGGKYSSEVGIKLDNRIAPAKLRMVTQGEPVHFQVLVVCFIALELATEDLLPNACKYWPYRYLKIRPSVYSLQQFTIEKLRLLRAQVENFDQLALEACQLHDSAFLDELASGRPVTYRTARLLKKFVDGKANENPALRIGGVLCQLNSGHAKTKTCNRSEYF